MAWNVFFEREDIKEELEKINKFLRQEEEKWGEELEILPPPELRFRAFDLCPLNDIKVCILGQDPYFHREEAMGLCFSVPENIKIPPSLRNIFKELKEDTGIERTNTDLTNWASQGVLLLNTALSVREHCPNSHSKQWKVLTDKLIQHISNNNKGVIFVLWGGNAKIKEDLIDVSKHHILKSSHPSPLGAYRGFLGCKHFSKINEILLNQKQLPIDW
tara:strand:+ start:2162 stop:2812 length:651 start_codon:yes stop_codon:yes gene_type:complete